MAKASANLTFARQFKAAVRDHLLRKRLLRDLSDAFPELTYQSVKLLANGNDHAILILDDRLVFRFPRSGYQIARLPLEIDLLRALREKTTVSVPDYRYVAPKAVFGGYPMISGRELMPETFAALDRAQQKRALVGIADLLSGLHSLPLQLIARADGVPVLGEKYTDEWPVEERRSMLATIAPHLLDPLEQFYAGSAAAMDYPNQRLLHGDLTGKHILLGTDARSIGCIDFSDAVAGDPAWDFAFLSCYGPWATPFVFERYGLASEEAGLVNRSRWLAPKLGISSLRWRLTRPKPCPTRIAEAVNLLGVQLSNAGVAISSKKHLGKASAGFRTPAPAGPLARLKRPSSIDRTGAPEPGPAG